MEEIEITTRLDATSDQVWRRIVTPEGINYELRPWLRMTIPRSLRGATVDTVPVGKELGRSWILLLGFLPFDYDDLLIAELGPARRFLETSRTFSASRWEHERIVTEDGQGAQLRDRVRFQPRGVAAIAPRIMRVVVSLLFRHRHRRLVGYFGSPPGARRVRN